MPEESMPDESTGTPVIVLINGPCSAGKTAIGDALQRCSRLPFLHTGVDFFMRSLGERHLDVDGALLPSGYAGFGSEKGEKSVQGFQVSREGEGEGATLQVAMGPVARRFILGMHRSFAAMASAGNHLIIADVITEPLMHSYVEALAEQRVFLVGLHCSLEELERREKARGDRLVGSAQIQYQRVHQPGIYDLELHSDAGSPEQCAETIETALQEWLRSGMPSGALQRLQDHFGAAPVTLPDRLYADAVEERSL